MTEALQAVQTYDCGGVVQPPVASYSVNNTSGCAPLTVNFNSTSTGNGLSYSWSFPGGNPTTSNIAAPSVTYNTAGTHTATLTVTNAGGSDTYQTNITVNSNSTPPTITQNGSILTASSGSTFQWYINGDPITGATGQTYTITQNGAYTVIATDANGCVSPVSAPVFTNVSIEENEVVLFSVYPNPTSGSLMVNWNTNDRATVKVLDMQGRVLRLVNDIQSGSTLDIQSLASGIYIIDIEVGKENRNFKIQKIN